MIRALLADNKVFATPVVLYLVSKFGDEALSFEYETIEEYLKSLQPKTPKAVINRVNAALGLFSSDLFWVNPISFSSVCRTLNRHKFPMADEPSPGDLTWGVTEAKLLYEGAGTEGSVRFSDSVQSLVSYLFSINGLFSLPEALSDMGEVSLQLNIADAEMAYARQQESDRAAAKLDIFAAKQTAELFNQIKALKLPLQPSAEKEMDNILAQFKELKIA